MASNCRHLKRTNMPTSWPVKRKNITFVAKPNSGSHKLKYVTSVVVLLRDVLGYAKISKGVRHAINHEEILINGKKVTDIKTPVGMFDVFEIKKTNEKYVLIFDEVGKIKLVATKDDTINLKISKKTILPGKKLQLNFMNGFNILVDAKTFKSASVQDTIIYDFVKKKVMKVLALAEKAQVYLFDGKFKGRFATVNSFVSYNGLTKDIVEVVIGKEKHTTAKDYCYVIEDIKRYA